MIDNGTGRLLCFFPQDDNCTDSYIVPTTGSIKNMRTILSVVVCLVLLLCIFNNGSCYYVFNRRQFRGKLLTVLIKNLYIGNTVYVVIVSVYTIMFYSYPFDFGVWVAYTSCRVLWACMRVGVTFTNWLLAIAGLLRMNMTVFPTKFMVFRGRVENSRTILAGIMLICIGSNIQGIMNPTLDICVFSNRVICVIEDYDVFYFIFGYFVTLFICVITSIVIYIHSHKARKLRSSFHCRLYSPVNQMVISSSFLFALSSIPKSIYYSYYNNEMDVYCEQDNSWRFILFVSVTFVNICNNSLDGTMYFIVSPSYRKVAQRWYVNIWHRAIRRKKSKKSAERSDSLEAFRRRTIVSFRKASVGEEFTNMEPESELSRTPEFSTDEDDPVHTLKVQLNSGGENNLEQWFTQATRELLRRKRNQRLQEEAEGTQIRGNSIRKTTETSFTDKGQQLRTHFHYYKKESTI